MSENNPSYYAVIPANVRYDTELKANEKLLYGEITVLCNRTGECWASNKYFADLYNVTTQAISKWILNLKSKGYILVEYVYKKDSKEIEKRVIRIVSTNVSDVSTNVDGGINKCLRGYQQMFKDNNTSINNTSINNINNKKFTKPTLEKVEQYCRERNNNIDAESFINYYDSIGWKIGKNPMKDWRAAVRTWERNNKKYNNNTTNNEIKLKEVEDGAFQL